MDSLAALRLQLTGANQSLQVNTLGNVQGIRELTRQLNSKFGEGRAPSGQAVLTAVRAFMASGQLPDFRALKLVCYGMAQRPQPSGPCVLENASLTDQLLKSLERLNVQGSFRQFRRCCQGLLSVYFAENPFDAKGKRLASGWIRVRDFLMRALRDLTRGERAPDWAGALNDHANLLSDTPCDKYGKAFLAGNKELFESACTRLGISSNSWVREQVILSAVKSATELDDSGFTSRIGELLKLLESAPSLKRPGLVMILDRYARNESRLSQLALQTVALTELGNPLLKSMSHRWDGISPAAKEMVGEWLKAKVVEQFFQLLSHDGATDQRRVKFWSSYVPVIENIWLVLGSAARSNLNQDFKELRRLMGDQALRLEGGSYKNNAFVMKIGRQYIVEFGEKGNAVYVYSEGLLPFQLSGELHLSNDLKSGTRRLHHRDGHVRWEDRFRSELKLPAVSPPQSGSRVRAAQANVPVTVETSNPQNFERAFKLFCTDHGLRYIDKRPYGGHLIIELESRDSRIAGTLEQWGFEFDSSRNRWIKS